MTVKTKTAEHSRNEKSQKTNVQKKTKKRSKRERKRERDRGSMGEIKSLRSTKREPPKREKKQMHHAFFILQPSTCRHASFTSSAAVVVARGPAEAHALLLSSLRRVPSASAPHQSGTLCLYQVQEGARQCIPAPRQREKEILGYALP